VIAVVAGAAAVWRRHRGLWSPLQAFYVAIKLPLLILLTSLGNGLLNGMLAAPAWAHIGFRQSLTAVLVKLCLCPLVPARSARWDSSSCGNPAARSGHRVNLIRARPAGKLTLVLSSPRRVVGNYRLLPVLRQLAGSRSVAAQGFVCLAGGQSLPGQPDLLAACARSSGAATR